MANNSTMMDEILGRVSADAPTDQDVVFGRGGFANKHPANKHYLELVSKHEVEYMHCKRKYQKLISLCIIHYLRVKGARFMEKEKSGTWKTVRLTRCREKISQRLRERIPFIKLEELKASQTKSLTRSPQKVAQEDKIVTKDRKPSMHAPPAVIVVTDASSDEESSFLGSAADLDDASLFSVPKQEEQPKLEADDDTISLVSSVPLEYESFDDIFDSMGSPEQHTVAKRLAMFEADFQPPQPPRKKQKRDGDDYSYGPVIECCHQDDNSLLLDDYVQDNGSMCDFADVFSVTEYPRSGVTIDARLSAPLAGQLSARSYQEDNEAALLDYFLL